jgi:hypothetical protein
MASRWLDASPKAVMILHVSEGNKQAIIEAIMEAGRWLTCEVVG